MRRTSRWFGASKATVPQGASATAERSRSSTRKTSCCCCCAAPPPSSAPRPPGRAWWSACSETTPCAYATRVTPRSSTAACESSGPPIRIPTARRCPTTATFASVASPTATLALVPARTVWRSCSTPHTSSCSRLWRSGCSCCAIRLRRTLSAAPPRRSSMGGASARAPTASARPSLCWRWNDWPSPPRRERAAGAWQPSAERRRRLWRRATSGRGAAIPPQRPSTRRSLRWRPTRRLGPTPKSTPRPSRRQQTSTICRGSRRS
mmetsp:Transcript_4374/g.13820  ORF Transcript_4374/g.13820 Transcript_4374/m.13820 type:complete len:264 (-) Transcript_4374:458-1249(-)